MAKETENTEVKPAGITAAYFAEMGAKTRKQKADGGEEVTVSLTNLNKVRFTKDFGKHIKAGDEQQLSDVAFAIYEKAGVIEKVN